MTKKGVDKLKEKHDEFMKEVGLIKSRTAVYGKAQYTLNTIHFNAKTKINVVFLKIQWQD